MKNLSVNLFMCLHLETNSSSVLNSDSGSAFMIASFSVKHRSHFLGFTNYRPLKVIIYAAIFQLPDIYREFCTFFFTFISIRSGMVVVRLLEFFFLKYHNNF